MTLRKLILVLACLTSGTLVAQEAKVTQLLSKDLKNLPGKEGLMVIVEYPPGELGPYPPPQCTWIYLCAGGLDCDAGERGKGNGCEPWTNLL